MDIIYWRNFCTTYDIYYLNLLSDKSKTILKTYLNKNVKFKGLQRILNLYFKPQPQLKCNVLTDIVSLSYHTSHVYKKKIYIFGESHNLKENCSIKKKNSCNVYDFIKHMFNIPKMMDMFLETPTIIKGGKYRKTLIESSPLMKFSNRFENCLDLIKKCKNSNVRFHNTDVRKGKSKNLPFFMKLEINIVDTLFYAFRYHDLKIYKMALKEINELLSDSDRNEYIKNSKSYDLFIPYLLNVYNKFKILRQLEKIPYKHVKNILTNYLYSKISKIDLKYFQLDKIISIISKFPKDHIPFELFDDLVYLLKYVRENLIELTANFMDFYLMSRLFRRFKQINFQNSKEPENIIIYVGDIHADNYRAILKKLDFQQEFITKAKGIFVERYDKDWETCIDISKLKYPLFEMKLIKQF
jgi:hypothetical protein